MTEHVERKNFIRSLKDKIMTSGEITTGDIFAMREDTNKGATVAPSAPDSNRPRFQPIAQIDGFHNANGGGDAFSI